MWFWHICNGENEERRKKKIMKLWNILMWGQQEAWLSCSKSLCFPFKAINIWIKTYNRLTSTWFKGRRQKELYMRIEFLLSIFQVHKIICVFVEFKSFHSIKKSHFQHISDGLHSSFQLSCISHCISNQMKLHKLHLPKPFSHNLPKQSIKNHHLQKMCL